MLELNIFPGEMIEESHVLFVAEGRIDNRDELLGKWSLATF
jgi:hypothetical protein